MESKKERVKRDEKMTEVSYEVKQLVGNLSKRVIQLLKAGGIAVPEKKIDFEILEYGKLKKKKATGTTEPYLTESGELRYRVSIAVDPNKYEEGLQDIIETIAHEYAQVWANDNIIKLQDLAQKGAYGTKILKEIKKENLSVSEKKSELEQLGREVSEMHKKYKHLYEGFADKVAVEVRNAVIIGEVFRPDILKKYSTAALAAGLNARYAELDKLKQLLEQTHRLVENIKSEREKFETLEGYENALGEEMRRLMEIEERIMEDPYFKGAEVFRKLERGKPGIRKAIKILEAM